MSDYFFNSARTCRYDGKKGELVASNSFHLGPDFFRGVLKEFGCAAEGSRFLMHRRYKLTASEPEPAVFEVNSSNVNIRIKVA